MTEEDYIVATDLAKLRIAREVIADTSPEFWSGGVTDREEWDKRRVNILIELDEFIAIDSRLIQRDCEV